jgi:hypothetical protein
VGRQIYRMNCLQNEKTVSVRTTPTAVWPPRPRAPVLSGRLTVLYLKTISGCRGPPLSYGLDWIRRASASSLNAIAAIRWKRRRLLLAVEEGMTWRQGRLLEFNAHSVDWRTEYMLAVPGVLQDALQCLLQVGHANAGSDLADSRLLCP